VIRVIDTVSNTVSSICRSSPLVTQSDDLFTEASSISECTIATLYSVGIFPEHNFILLGSEKGLIKLHIRINAESKCSIHCDFTNYSATFSCLLQSQQIFYYNFHDKIFYAVKMYFAIIVIIGNL